MKKLFTAITLGSVAAVCAFCGCTPKPVSLWCGSPISDARFIFEYSASNSTYDGLSRAFSVKDAESFEEYLTGLDGYIGTMQYADDDGKEFFAFLVDGEIFVCNAKDSDGRYEAHSSCYCINGSYFYYPHAETNWDYSVELDYGGVNTYVTTTVQDWDYFKTFYSYIDCAVTDDESKSVEFQNVTLTVGDGLVYWTIDYGEN